MDAGKGVNTYLLMVFAILLVSFVTEFPVKAQTEGDPCSSNPCWNGGSCATSSTGFTCICAPDFIGSFCESQSHPHDLVFVTNLSPPGIYVAPTDTFNFTLIPGLDGSHSNISRPVAIDYDPIERMVYWTDITLDGITRAFLDGTGVEVLFTDLQIPDGLTLDVENRVMYWTDTGSDLIERATLDGRERSVVLNLASGSLTAVEPRGIVVDPANSHLYWTDWGTAPKIERSGTDGSGRRVLIDTNLRWPNGISLDLEGGRMYWCDAGTDLIEYSDLLGQGRTVLVDLTSIDIHPFDLFVYYDFIYWSDWFSPSLLRVEASERLLGNHGSESFGQAGGIHIFKDDPCTSNSCRNGGSCLGSSGVFTCACPPGFIGFFCESQSHPHDLVFVTNWSPPGIYVAPTDTFNFTLIPGLDGSNDNISHPRAIDYDPVERMVYWTDIVFNGITRAFLDGTGVEVLVTDLQASFGLTLDVENRVMYWTDEDSDLIERATLDGRERSVVLNLANSSLGDVRPRGIVVDPANSHLYWTDVGTAPKIERADTDGSGRRVLIDTSLTWPFGISLDLEGGRMYWCDVGTQRIEYSDLLGQGRTVLVERTSFTLHAYDLFVYYDFIYWTNWASSTIQRVEASGRLLGNHGSESFTHPVGIHIFKDDPCSSNPCWNGGSCVTSSTGFTCICAADFIGSFCESQSHPHDLVFVTNRNPPGIYVAPTDTFNFTLIPGLDGSHVNISRPIAIDYDPVERMVYWTDNVFDSITRAFLDGSGVEVLVTDLQAPLGLTLDIENRVMYWTDEDSDLIERATLDGQEQSTVLNLASGSLGTVYPRGIVVDPANSHLYWTDWGQYPKIERADTDGSGRRVLIDTALVWPNGISLDLEGGRMYWCDAGTDRIEYSDLLGQGRTVLVDSTSFNIHAYDLFVYYDFIYWTDKISSTIKRVEASGRLLGNHGSESFTSPFGIHIFKANICQQMVCQHGGHCQLFEHHYVCICAQGYSGRNCENDNLPPTFTTGCPSNIPHLADNNQRSVPVSWPDLSASDPSTPLLWNSTHQPGDIFSVGGDTMVTYTVTDQAGNAASCNFTVTVTGVGLDCPSNVTTLTNPGVSVANVSWALPSVTFNGPQQPVMFYVGSPPTQTTSDTDLQVRVYSEYQPNTVFNLGATRVTYRVQELGTQCHFHAIVIQVDNEPPMISGCPGDVIIPAKPSTDQVAYSWPPPVISDNAGPVDVTFGCRPTKVWKCNQTGSGMFTFGVTKVMYNVTDASGNRNMCQFKITVTAVDLDCPVNLTVDAKPGSTSTSVDWMEPVVTGWDGPTNFTSSLSPGVELQIGSHVVNYRQWFEYGLILDCSFSVQVIGFCPASTTNDALHGRLMWLATRRGTTAESFERCPLMTSKAGQPFAVRNCSVVAPPFYFQWGNHVPRSCGEERNEVTLDEVIYVNVSRGNVNEVVEFLANQTSESTESAEDVEAVSTILMNIVGAGSGDTEVTKLVIQTVSNVIMSTSQTPDSQTPEVNAGSSSAIVQSVEAQVSLTLRQDGPVSIQQDTIHVEAVSLNPMLVSNGLTFVSAPQQQTGQSSPQEGSLVGTEVTTLVNASVVPQDVIASIRLPASIVKKIQDGNENGSQPLRASFIVYADDTLFKSALIKGSPGKNGSSLQVAGSVVSLTVEDVELVNLTEPVVIQFKAPANNETEGNRTIECVFWDFDLNDRVGDWSTAGCLLARETNDTVSCNCSHATNFAILVNVHGQKETSKVFRDVLNIITNVGCAISIIALVITLTVYLAIKKLRTGKSRQIFIHMFFAWLMLYIVFLAGIDNAKGSGGGCVFVAALLHYFVLSTLMWTAVEARNMYVSAVKVFPEDTPHYMLKACLIAWGSPLIVLTITLAAATDHYGNEHYCFLEPDLVLYLGLLAPIGLILIHNIITFVLVMRSILKVKEASRSQQISKRLQNAVGISTLMGLTWSFGFLVIIHGAATSGDGAMSNDGAGLAFELIFCLANSFQGLIVFIMFCVRREEVRTALAPYMKRLCCGRTCDIQVPWKKDRSYDLPMMSESVPSSPSTAHTAEFDMSVSGPY